MTELDDIRRWLNKDKRPFDEGLQLYLVYITDKSEKFFIEKRRDEGRLYDLIYDRYQQLKQAIEVCPPPDGDAVAISEAVGGTEPESKRVRSVAALPLRSQEGESGNSKADVIAKLEKEWKQLRAEQGVWHTQMCDIGIDEKGNAREMISTNQQEARLKLASQLVKHDQEIYRIWNLIDYVEINGHLPAKAKKVKVVELLPEEDYKQLTTSIRPNISKLKKKIKDKQAAMINLQGNAWVKANEAVSKWENQLKELEQKRDKIEQIKAA